VEAIKTSPEGHIVVVGPDMTLTYTPRLVTLDDGTHIAHTSVGGDMASVWAADLGGDLFVEVAHLGAGPRGGELVMTVTSITPTETRRWVALGDLWTEHIPEHVEPSWAAALDLSLGLLQGEVELLGATAGGRPATADDVDQLHQRILGVLHG
jgi:hypothetical protein